MYNEILPLYKGSTVPVANSGERLQSRLIALFIGLWIVVTLQSLGVIFQIFSLSSDQKSYLAIIIVVGAVFVSALSVWRTRQLCRPILEFARSQPSDREHDRIVAVAQGLYLKVGVMGILGPILLLLITGILLQGILGGPKGSIIFMIILGLFDAMFMGTCSSILTQKWVNEIQELAAGYKGKEPSIQQVSLKTKFLIIGLALSIVPTLMVCSMAFLGADQLLADVAASKLNADAASGSLFSMIIVVFLFAVVIASITGVIFVTSSADNIQQLVSITTEVSKGDLTGTVPVIGDDELGLLRINLQITIENFRRLVGAVVELSNEVKNIGGQMLLKTSAISSDSNLQIRSVEGAAKSLETFNQNTQALSEILQNLNRLSQEATEASKKVGDGFTGMQNDMGTLQTTVSLTGELVERFTHTIPEVAANMGALTEGVTRSAQSMEDMERSISMVSNSANDTAQIAQVAIEVAQNGAAAVRRTIEGMDRIVASTGEASNVIVGLGTHVEAIGGILVVIQEIADQTNLLALNAAIIAAQAGEHGRGFAVVADEIRSLAERTSSSTREIGQMIAGIQGASEEAIKVIRGGGSIVNEGVALAQQAGNALNQILVSVQKAAENVGTIAGYTEGQARSSLLVTSEIGKLAEMAQLISKAASEQSQAGVELQVAFRETLKTTQALGKQVNQQAQENRQSVTAVASINEVAGRATKALAGQSSVLESVLKTAGQISEIAKNHTRTATEISDMTQALEEKNEQLQGGIGEFKV
jgi:methyl-accepting chemotaxis protein